MTDQGPATDRTPAAILEEHSKESIDRINKIDRWVHTVSYWVMALAATSLLTVIGVAVAVILLIDEIDSSRYDTAVKGCQISRQATHDGMKEMFLSLTGDDPEKTAKAKTLVDTYLPFDKKTCEAYADLLGLEP
jgi:hypothetical protein